MTLSEKLDVLRVAASLADPPSYHLECGLIPEGEDEPWTQGELAIVAKKIVSRITGHSYNARTWFDGSTMQLHVELHRIYLTPSAAQWNKVLDVFISGPLAEPWSDSRL